MLHKYSELDIYEDFINGNLNPIKLQGAYLTTISKYLNEQVENCQDMILGKFKVSGRKKELIEKVKISTAHPLAPEYFYQNHLFRENSEEILSKEILDQLDVAGQSSEKEVVIKKQEQHSLVGVAFESEWDEIEADRLRYCYINQVLEETVSRTKYNLRSDIFSLSEEKAKSIVYAVQRLLTSYLNDILQQFMLKESDMKVKIKPGYTNKDCSVLIYMTIVDLLNFIYSHFYEYMDHKQKVPFFSSIANQNDFVSSAKKILKLLKNVEMDSAIYSFVKDKLEKVLNININTRITYEEVNYFNKFLNSFLRFLEKDKYYTISEDQIIQFLIMHNFNDFIFYEYLIKKARLDLSDCDNANEMEITLLRKLTELKQINTATNEKLIADRDDLLPMLLRWLEMELNYVNKLKSEPDFEIQNNGIRLKTNLTASELALLFKVLHYKGHVDPETKNELVKWIQQSFKNHKSESFSLQHIRNNMYNHSTTAIEKVKNIGIDVMNESKLV